MRCVFVGRRSGDHIKLLNYLEKGNNMQKTVAQTVKQFCPTCQQMTLFVAGEVMGKNVFKCSVCGKAKPTKPDSRPFGW